MGNTNNHIDENDIEDNTIKLPNNMYRRDTKTQWTQQQLLQYQSELEKELQRQTNLANNNDSKNNSNIFTCCITKQRKKDFKEEIQIKEDKEIIKIKMEDDKKTATTATTATATTATATATATTTTTTTTTIKIIDIDDGITIEEEEDGSEELLMNTTNAFLELLQLDTMSQHLQEMRDRRMFLEAAANDIDLPEEEREVAAWITDTYLCKSPTTLNYIINKMNTNAQNNGEEEEKKRKEEEINKRKILEINNINISEIISIVNPSISLNNNIDKISKLLLSINEWNFSVFEFVELCNHSSLSLLMLTICRSRNISKHLNIDNQILCNYMNAIDINYLSNPYHNNIHASDVLLNIYYFMKSKIFLKNISILDCFSILIAASIHDVGHPGHGNSFEIATESELAIRYNDKSVLENMHISLAWNLLKKNKNSNIISNFNILQKKRFRKILIESVLATDMSQHSLHSETLEKLVEKYIDKKIEITGTEIEKFSNEFLPIALHTADLGNLCKEIKYYNEWVDRLMNEFFNQGDKERELGIKPISFLCDRFKVNIHSGQVGFINFVIRPWFSKFGRLLSESTHNQLFLNLLNENLKYMQERANQTKDAQEEIKKNEKLINPISNNNNNIPKPNNNNIPITTRTKQKIIKPKPKPNIIPIDKFDNNNNVNPRTSKSYSIIAMSMDAMKSKLLEYNDKEKHQNQAISNQ